MSQHSVFFFFLRGCFFLRNRSGFRVGLVLPSDGSAEGASCCDAMKHRTSNALGTRNFDACIALWDGFPTSV